MERNDLERLTSGKQKPGLTVTKMEPSNKSDAAFRKNIGFTSREFVMVKWVYLRRFG